MTSLPNISPDLIKAYQEQIAKSGSPATAKRKAISLNRFFDWAESQGHIDENPLTKLESDQIPQIVKIKKNVGKRTYLTIGLTTALIILVFLLTWKLKFPISFIQNFAQENTVQTAQNTVQNSNPISASPAAILAWNLYAKLKLTDTNDQPIVGSQSVGFKLYNSATGGDALYTSNPQTVTTDTDGSALISLDNVPDNLFFQNNTLYLEPQVGSSSGQMRIPVSTANTAANLEGYFPANPEAGATPETIPVISSDGSLLLASQSPSVKAKNGNLLVEGQAVVIKAADGSGGNIEINPDANGYAHFLFEGNKGNFLNAQAPNLTSGSLYYGMVPNNSTGYYLINLQNGSKLKTKFSVDAVGNTNMAGDLSTGSTDRLTSTGALQNITGYSQGSGNFTVSQNSSDSASITKNNTALSDVMDLTLNENDIPNSHYSTLVLNRSGGDVNSRALLVGSGDAQFNGQLQLGRFSSLPNAIGQGSLVFNSSDNKVYVWDGNTWVAVGTGGGGGSSAFSDITSGTNTSASMVVGSGSSLGFTGTGTITSSGINCAGCVSNSNLTNSNITVNTSGILTGGGTVALGGTLNLTATEADTLNSVTGRGATTTNAISVGNLTSTGITTFNGNTYTWPGSQTPGGFLTTNGSGTLGWTTSLPSGTTVGFDKIASGTNTTASMVVGTGASLNYSGTGTINASSLEGSTWEAPGTIGSTTPNTGAFTTLSANSTVNLGSLTASKVVFTDASKNLTSTGTVAVGQGGTGLTSYTVGDLLNADSTSTLASLADVAAGNVLLSGGVGAVPSYGKVVLGTHTTGNYVSSITGTANQITSSSLTGDTTLSIPSDFRAPGTVNATNGIYTGATAGTERIDASGNLTNIGTTQLNSQTYTWPGSSGGNGQVLSTNGSGTLSWTDALTGSSVFWTQSAVNGVLYPKSNTVDVLIGADSTGSAKFAFTGVDGGLPTASIAGNIANVATYLTGNGNLATTNMNTLTLGGPTTGVVYINNNLNVASGDVYQINGTSVLSSNTLGSGVVNSSLTQVGALTSGSIASGFGTIATANTITGTTINGTTGVNTGSGAGTQRIDANGNLSANYATVSASLALGTSNASAGPGNLDMSGNLTTSGTTTFGGLTYTWPGSQAANGYLQTNGTGGLSWTTNIAATSMPFSGLTSGTNTQAAMVVGNGASLNYTGTGTINASSLEGKTWEAPGTIGSSTPNTGAFTSVTTPTIIGSTSLALKPASDSTTAIQLQNAAGSSILNVDTTNGYIGIGTTSPAAKLDVNGNLNVSGYATVSASLALGSSNASAGPGNLDMSGNLNVAGTVNLSGLTASKVVFTDASKNLTSTGTVAVGQGGTGITSYTIGDLLYADTTSSLATLADAATGNVLKSGGVGAAPGWGKVVLGTDTSGNYVSTLTGTANQITVSGSTGDVTLSIPSDFRAPGTVNAVSGLYTGPTAGTERIDASGNLTNIGTTQLNGITYTWPLPINQPANGYLQTDGAGGLSWTTNIIATSMPFSGLTSATNTQAAMVVGTGASLNYTGTGTINASSLEGNTWEAPGTIGSTTPNSGAFTSMNLTTGNSYDINNVSVLNATTLGTNVVNSSLTQVGALASGSIANGFGSIATANTITGTTINGTTGVNTGTGAGTERIDASGNLTNIGNINATGTVNLTGLTASKVVFTDASKNLTSTGTVGVGQGGTGITSYTVGDLLYADTTSSLTTLADAATGNVLKSGGVGAAPGWGKVVLGTDTSGNYVSSITGTANQITTSSSTGDVTLSIPSDFRAPGTVNATNGIYTGAAAGTLRIDASGNLAANYATVSASLALGSSNASAGPGNLDMSGNLTTGGTTTFGGHTYTWPSTISSNNYVLQTQTNGTLAWVDPAAAIANSIYWTAGNGAIYPKNNTYDVLIGATAGSTATASAKFAFTGVNGGLPTASIAGNIANVATYLTGNGNLATTNMADLTLGGSSTGNVIINSRGSNALTANGNNLTTGNNITVGGTAYFANGTTYYIDASGNANLNAGTFAGNVNLLTGNEYRINNASVLSATTLGSGVINSSLTQVGALASGSIANGFGTISTANTITGTTINGTTGVNTGSGAGTQRIDANGNLSANYATVSASLAIGNVNAAAGPGNLTVGGNTILGGQTYTWPGSQNANGVLTTNGSGTLSWANSIPSGTTIGFDQLTSGTNTSATMTVGTGASLGYSGTGTINASSLEGKTWEAPGTIGLTTPNSGAFTSMNLTSGNAYDINNTSVLSATTLGSGVINSSLTQVGALANGSIANGFGSIATANTITGTALNGTTGINTGTGAGTQRIDANGNLSVNYATVSASLALGSSNASAGPGNLDMSGNLTMGGNLTVPGTTTFHGVAYTWPSSDAAATGYVLSSNGAGTLSWAAAATGSQWTQSAVNGVLYPSSNTVDVLIGGSATTSAKFAFTGVDGGLPTASIAGNVANVATYLTGNGNLATTNMADLTLGGSSTGNVVINSRGSNALTANGANLTAGGTLTFPNSNTLTGVSNYLELSQGISVGGGTTYYFDNTGLLNASKLQVSGIADTVQAYIKAYSTQTNHIQEWQNSAGTAQSWIDGQGNLRVGSGAVDNGSILDVAGAPTNDALAIFNTTGGTQNIIAASASGATKMTLDQNGVLSLYNSTSSITNTAGDITIGAASGNINFSGDNIQNINTVNAGSGVFSNVLQVNSTGALQAYSRFGNGTSSHGLISPHDVYITGKLDVGGVLYLSSNEIGNAINGTPAIILSAAPTTTANTLTAGNWLVENNSNLGQAALMVNQTLGGDIFTASASGTPKFTISNTGNVGIGTVSPTSPLDIYASSTNTASNYTALKIEGSQSTANTASFYGENIIPSFTASSGNTLANLYALSSNPQVTSTGTVTNAYNIYSRLDNTSTGTISNLYDLYLAAPGNTSGTITNKYALVTEAGAGNVGIGTTSPGALLSVAGTATVSGTLTLGNGTTNVLQSPYGPLTLNYKSGANTWAAGLTLQDSTGNVGIGTTSPKMALDIAGDITFTGALAKNGYYSSGWKYTGNSDAFMMSTNSYAGYTSLSVAPTGTTGNAISFSPAIVINNTNANVGIGTTSPPFKLSVMGAYPQLFLMSTDYVSGSTGSVLYEGPSGTGNVYSVIQAVTTGNTAYGNLALDPLGGNVGIGTPSPAVPLQVTGGVSQTFAGGGATAGTWASHSSGAVTTSILANNAIVGGSVYASSDRRLKNEIQNLNTDDINNFFQVAKPISFYWKDTGNADTGFVAQDLINEGYSYLVSEVPDSSMQSEVDPTGITDPSGMRFTVNYNSIIPLLTAKIQEQMGQISTISGELANLSLTSDGDLNISQDNSGNYQLTNTANNSIINQIAALAEVVAANIKAGAITTQNLATNSFTAFQGSVDNLLVKSGLVAFNIQTNLISPVPGGTNVTVQIGSGATPSGQFVIQNASGSAIATIDNTGNATFSGQVASSQLQVSSEATISGTLYADNIQSKSLDDIQALLTQVETDQNTLKNTVNWNSLSATNSANLDNLAVSDLYITNQAAINSLSVTNSLALGSDMVIGSDNTINTLSAPLKIQSLAMAPVEIMDGLVTIDTKGNVNIAGDLAVAGRVKASGLTLKDNVQDTVLQASDSATLLTLQDSNGNTVSSVNSSGSAQFNSITTPQLIVGGASDATVAGTIVNGVITTNSTIGIATIPAGTADITIKNPKISDYTLIYVTPTSGTQNNVLYVKEKSTGYFKVGFDQAINTDVSFNWWIVQAGQ